MNQKKTSAKTVRVQLGKRTYPIVIGPGIASRIGKWLAKHPSAKASRAKRAFIVADRSLEVQRATLREGLSKSGWETHEIPVQAGESLKDFQNLYPLYGELLRLKANRDSVLIALGGGSVGDAAGFLASTYLRGISWVGVPTTLLAQVDSAIGGKTAVNHSSGKNLIGTFHQPSLVACDTDFLQTLGRREIVSGLGEIVKYGLIFDPQFLRFLEENLDLLLSLDRQKMTLAIQRSAAWKAKVVSRDEFDLRGIREALNFGHTFGHALESLTRYEVFQHGEAVIWGMRFALALSEVRKKLSAKDREKYDSFLRRLELPALPECFSSDDFMEIMSRDKKVRGGKIHFVLLRSAGKTVSDSSVSHRDIERAFAALREKA